MVAVAVVVAVVVWDAVVVGAEVVVAVGVEVVVGAEVVVALGVEVVVVVVVGVAVWVWVWVEVGVKGRRMTDEELVKRLRAVEIDDDHDLWENSHLLAEAASAIERLTQQRDILHGSLTNAMVRANDFRHAFEVSERKVEKLREALKPFAAICVSHEIPDGESGEIETFFDCAELLRARAALAETEKTDE